MACITCEVFDQSMISAEGKDLGGTVGTEHHVSRCHGFIWLTMPTAFSAANGIAGCKVFAVVVIIGLRIFKIFVFHVQATARTGASAIRFGRAFLSAKL